MAEESNYKCQDRLRFKVYTIKHVEPNYDQWWNAETIDSVNHENMITKTSFLLQIMIAFYVRNNVSKPHRWIFHSVTLFTIFLELVILFYMGQPICKAEESKHETLANWKYIADWKYMHNDTHSYI